MKSPPQLYYKTNLTKSKVFFRKSIDKKIKSYYNLNKNERKEERKLKNINIKMLRIKENLTQEDMAKEIGCSKVSYIQKEKGRVDFTKDEMKRIKENFDLTLSEFWEIFFE